MSRKNPELRGGKGKREKRKEKREKRKGGALIVVEERVKMLGGPS